MTVVAAAVFLALLPGAPTWAHPMPNSIMQLDVLSDSLTAELQIPVDDLSIASGVELRRVDANDVLTRRATDLQDYLARHLAVTTTDGRLWIVKVGQLHLGEAEQTATGPYREVIAHATWTPPAGADIRRFVVAADLVVHEVVTHSIVVTIHNDWGAGEVAHDGAGTQIGIIAEDTRTMNLEPLMIELDRASTWRGFTAMVHLGTEHIASGTDHLLFLLVLLLPAPLIAVGGRWRGAVSTKRTIIRMTRITLAFTLGHSLTLALSALGRLQLPATPIEVFISLSILIGAVHALRPLFPGREALTAGLFGLVHGMAFSFTLAELGLTTSQLILSLLGFNLGIELMQLGVVLLTLPSLVVLSRTNWYRPVRVLGALCAALASIGWILARVGVPNPVATLADQAGQSGIVVVIGLAVLAALAFAWQKRGGGDANGSSAEHTTPTSAPSSDMGTAARIGDI
ncbi:HupE/UreJ family protein [Gordonia sp. C13]|uniref:HupE/UreJ family protein n=1 Tax=Gordonia sp. C13 TaxID=2935078 RepID=UPI00200B32E7|nr:HupE/UreJ family protein [Gordonia sp. C13]MCK8616691.1 HupE/UreJ family protein [Gordonia sp. C13]